MTQIDIRPTQAGDVPALQAVLEQTGLFPADLLPEMIGPALAGEVQELWFTALSDGIARGFCYAVPEEMTDGTWNLLAIAVDPEVQGLGFGRLLVDAAERRLQTDGQRLLLVDTSGKAEFDGARQFYLHLGFAEEARIRDFWADGDDKITFRKSLV